MMQRKIRLIHQIEITSRCNLACKYCVHPKMIREKTDMDFETFKKSIFLVKHSMIHHGQNELNICGIGESTLHLDFIDYCKYAREQLGNGIVILLSTNGIGIEEKTIIEASKLNVKFFVSLHRPEKAGLTIELMKKHNCIIGVDSHAALNATDWAGQVKWFVSSPNKECFWVPDGRVFVDSTGTIRTCCYDGNAKSNLGHVEEGLNIFEKETMPYVLCKTCHMNTNLEGV